ncbi:MAG: 50S ribosomal protein L4 [Ignavibacteria bacterium]|jgi:large subunit ribosomal protein L4|nr:50S ribosomal protein L4 [Ignavibacteria bacterium]MBM4174184.1 50S ribosomal protein L4 [Ignavibacteria bacterium]
MLVNVYGKNGSVTGQVELPEEVFNVEPSEHAMYLAVKAYLANQRQGTAKTKVRSEVRGGGKKPWKQKGRGTARAGSSRSPVWVGGGTIHGPRPHLYKQYLPAQMKKLARKSALSLRVREENLLVVEGLGFDEIKTKNMVGVLKALNINGQKSLIMLKDSDVNIVMSARNIPGVKTLPAVVASTYDILNHKNIILCKEALQDLVQTF